MAILQRFEGAGVWPRDIPFCGADSTDLQPASRAAGSGQAQEMESGSEYI